MKKLFNKKGFTLIELLVVIAIIAALAVVVFAAINPGKRLREARNSRRAIDATTILDSLHTYIVDANGIYPSVITNAYSTGTSVLQETMIGTGTAAAGGTCTPTTTTMPTGSLCFAGGTQTTGSAQQIGRSCIDLSGGTITPAAAAANTSVTSTTGTGISSVMASNPIDPNATTAGSIVSPWAWRSDGVRTGYSIAVDTNGIITIRNCNAETAVANTMVPLSVAR